MSLPDAVTMLVNGRDYIEKHGWCRSAFVSGSGQACLVGAVLVGNGLWDIERDLFVDDVDLVEFYGHPAISCLYASARDKYVVVPTGSGPESYIFGANDEHLTCKSDALVLFDRAIEKAELL